MSDYREDLDMMMRWRGELDYRIKRARLRIEFANIGNMQEQAEEDRRLAREVAEFNNVWRGLRRIIEGSAQ